MSMSRSAAGELIDERIQFVCDTDASDAKDYPLLPD